MRRGQAQSASVVAAILQLALNPRSQTGSRGHEDCDGGADQNHQVRSGQGEPPDSFSSRSSCFSLSAGAEAKSTLPGVGANWIAWRGGLRVGRSSARAARLTAASTVSARRCRALLSVSENDWAEAKRLQRCRLIFRHAHRRGEHRTNTESAAELAIHARINLGIVAAKQPAGLDAFAGEAGAHLQARADGRSV